MRERRAATKHLEWRGGDPEDRREFVEQQKKRLALDKLTYFSSKRAPVDGKLKEDMPFLEFRQVHRSAHINSLFKQQELPWSIAEFVNKQDAMEIEHDSRYEAYLAEVAQQ